MTWTWQHAAGAIAVMGLAYAALDIALMFRAVIRARDEERKALRPLDEVRRMNREDDDDA